MAFIEDQDLDDVAELTALDRGGALLGLATAGAQVREAITLAEEAGVERAGPGERPRAVVVAATGSSAVVAHTLEVLAGDVAPVPVVARRNTPLPGWVGPMDLVVAVSVSGRAKGPLALAAEAARRGAALLTVGAEESPLADVCHRARGVHVGVGGQRDASRTALWSLLTPVLMAGTALGVTELSTAELGRVAHALDSQAEACRPSSDACVNPAKLLAMQVAETVPLVLGESPLTGVVARRAASMLARTARFPAVGGELPDAASEIVATFDGPFTAGGGRGVVGSAPENGRAPRWGGRDIFADPFLDAPAQPQLGLLLIRDGEAPRMVADSITEIAREAGVKVVDVEPIEGSPVERFAAQVAFLDFTATYLALGLGLDPLQSRHLAELRARDRG